MKKRLLACVLAAVSAAGLCACSSGAPTISEGTVVITVYAAGYGTDWLDEAIKEYQKTDPDVKFYPSGDPLAFETVKTKLENGTCTDDIILVSSSYYNQFVSSGYLEDLSDVYSSTIPGTDKTVASVIPEQIKNIRTKDGKIYGIPWQQNNGSGLVYNVEMFERYGWKLPETMDEFWELCEKIDTDTKGRVAPLTFGGADGFGYLAYNPAQWLCQYYGYDAMIDFLKMESPEAYAVQAEGRQKVYETLARITKGTLKSGRPISLDGSVGATAITAQTNFVGGKAAMIVNGQWFPTEMKTYTELTGFVSGFCPMPHINADKKSGDGKTDTSNIRFSTDGNMMAIPKGAKNAEKAKAFLLSMFTPSSYQTFIKANNGLTRPIEGLVVDGSSFTGFTKEAFDYAYDNGNSKTVYQISTNQLLDTGSMGIFMAYKGGFFANITNKATYEEALAVAKNCVASEIACVNDKWDSVNRKWND